MADTLQMALYRIDMLERKVTLQADEIAEIEARNIKRDQERQALERKQLLWGITFLGGIIMTLGSVIWSYRGVIFRGLS